MYCQDSFLSQAVTSQGQLRGWDSECFCFLKLRTGECPEANVCKLYLMFSCLASSWEPPCRGRLKGVLIVELSVRRWVSECRIGKQSFQTSPTVHAGHQPQTSINTNVIGPLPRNPTKRKFEEFSILYYSFGINHPLC